MKGACSSHSRTSLIITCEHGGNTVPNPYRQLFSSRPGVLKTHRGYDIGALPTARAFASSLGAPLRCSTVSRLLVDLNRSLSHPQVLSEFSRKLGGPEIERLLEAYYHPFRRQVRDDITAQLKRSERVLYISVHSFTPVLDGVSRNCDVGILYDPSRRHEAEVARAWQRELKRRRPQLKVRRNYPYRGTADGHAKELRGIFGKKHLLGVELEIKNTLAEKSGKQRKVLVTGLKEALLTALGN